MFVEFYTTIKRGLPVVARATISPPEPDVGLATPFIDGEIDIYFSTGHRYEKELSADDSDRIVKELFEYCEGYYGA